MTNNKIHICGEGQCLFTVENRGSGWHLYVNNIRGSNPINFCPRCGKSVKELDDESKWGRVGGIGEGSL